MENETASPAPKRKRRRQVSDPAQTSQENPSESMVLYTLTSNISGEAREGTPDRILIETVKNLNESENMVQTLRQQLRSKDNEENFSWIGHQVEHSVKNDLQCSICFEIFIEPTVLNCAHTFCRECIQSWSRNVNRCAICRVDIETMSPSLELDECLDKATEFLSDEVKSIRESLKKERNSNRDTADRHGGNQDQYAVVRNNVTYHPLFDPVRLGYVIDRNRDVSDDDSTDSSSDSN